MFRLSILNYPIETNFLKAMWAINQDNIPEVGSVPTLEEFQKLTLWSSHVIIVEENEEMAGFIILMREDQDYHSLNYKYLINKFDQFLYVDRVAIKDGFRRQGLGKKIYDEGLFNVCDPGIQFIFIRTKERPFSCISRYVWVQRRWNKTV